MYKAESAEDRFKWSSFANNHIFKSLPAVHGQIIVFFVVIFFTVM